MANIVDAGDTDDEDKGDFATDSNTDNGTDDLPGAPGTLTNNTVGALFTPGADGFGSISFTLPADLMAISQNSTTGLAVQSTVTIDSGAPGAPGETIFTASFTDGDGGTQTAFTITVGEDGSYSFTQTAALVHPSITPPGDAEENLDLTIDFTISDGDGDTATGSISIDVDDDTPIVGDFINLQVPNFDGETVSGVNTGFSSGADGFQSIEIEGPDIDGIEFFSTTSIDGDGNPTTTLSGHVTGDPSDVVFTFTTEGDGDYNFTLVQADAGSIRTIDLTNGLNSGNADFRETVPDGAIEFSTTSGDTINTSTQGFGVNNQFISSSEQFSVEFHTPGVIGDEPTASNPDFATEISFFIDQINGNGPRTFDATFVNTMTNETQTIAGISITSEGTISFSPTDFSEFNQFTLAGASGGGQGIRLTQAFVTSEILAQDQELEFTITATDGDGDQVSDTVTVNIDTSLPQSPPVILDLDGDGIETITLDAEQTVLFDIDNDGIKEETAFVSPDDGLLAIDLNGDGIVNDGSEIVFTQHAVEATTDLEAIAEVFDTNQDGKLSSEDAQFEQFGVFQDANSNGVTDEGEFRSLSELGISEINLESDGVRSVSEDGSVVTFGESQFTRTDGTTGIVGDVSFAHRNINPTQHLFEGELNNNQLALTLLAVALTAEFATEITIDISAQAATIDPAALQVSVSSGDDITGVTTDVSDDGNQLTITLSDGQLARGETVLIDFGNEDQNTIVTDDIAFIVTFNDGTLLDGTLELSTTSTDSNETVTTSGETNVVVGKTIEGTQIDDDLTGTSGDDVLLGLDGNDTLSGGDGDDILAGGLGSDTLTGGAGGDTFLIDADALDLTIEDIIVDFNAGEGDVVDLSEILENIDSADIDEFVRFDADGSSPDANAGDLQVDIDGNATGAEFVTVANVQNTPTVEILFNDTNGNDAIVQAPTDG